MDKGIDDLVNNKDIEENTQRAYIVGYLCKLLHETGHENAESKDEKYSWLGIGSEYLQYLPPDPYDAFGYIFVDGSCIGDYGHEFWWHYF